MLLTQATNIGLHVMTYLVQRQQTQNVTILTLAERFNVSPTYLAKILARLVKAHLITSITGVKGGYRIAVDPATVTFALVIAALDGRPDFRDGVEADSAKCAIAATIQVAQAQMWQTLATKRLIDLDEI